MIRNTFIFTAFSIVLAICLMLRNFLKVRKLQDHQDTNGNLREGTVEMYELAKIIRSGARTFMLTEYRTIIPIVIIVALALSLLVERFAGLTFLLGASMGTLSCFLGMEAAIYANVRTAAKADRTRSLPWTMKVAMLGGSVSGLSAHGFGLLGISSVLLVLMINGFPESGSSIMGMPVKVDFSSTLLMTCSLGYSLIAMFNRVAGGNFTKAADISADILAKVESDSMEEDDSRNPCTLADFVGDNVNDIAGNTSDLSESFVATIVSCVVTARRIFAGTDLANTVIMFALVLAASGLIGSVVGVGWFSFKKYRLKRGSYELSKSAMNHINPGAQLDTVTYTSALITVILSLVAARIMFSGVSMPDTFRLGWWSPWLSAICGIISGIAIGRLTEYYTSTDYQPVRKLALSATDGPAYEVTMGDALGSESVLFPMLTIAIALIVSSGICGPCGIAIAALGMLSFVAATVSIDAFGPIADNAGGIAEACHLDSDVRAITDQLDAAGNTTAAIGKGFAIGSAAFATVSLIYAYAGGYTVGEPVVNAVDPIVIAGFIVGTAVVWFFSALLSRNTIASAREMAAEGRKQLTPDVMAYKVKPNYDFLIEIATKNALRKMVSPSVLALFVPMSGFVFGPEFVAGVLPGSTFSSIAMALYMGNSGGAFDNAKKYVEQGSLAGHPKHSETHKTTVICDTIGDTRKDVVGVALDIFIKMMSTMANTLAPFFAIHHLF